MITSLPQGFYTSCVSDACAYDLDFEVQHAVICDWLRQLDLQCTSVYGVEVTEWMAPTNCCMYGEPLSKSNDANIYNVCVRVSVL